MLAFPAAAFATNCYVVAPGPGQECLVVDPGIGVVDTLRDIFVEHRLRPAAVLLTHGHADHVWSVTPVSRTAGEATAVRAPVPVHVHADDRYRLRDPLEQLEGQAADRGELEPPQPGVQVGGQRRRRGAHCSPSPASAPKA